MAWAVAVAFLTVYAYGLIWLPYYGDHALWAVVGRELMEGRALYSEVWDIKQPGVYLLYGPVQALFGYAPVVTRTLDVLIAVLTAVLVAVLVRDRVGPVIARWTGVAATAAMLLPARAFDLGQIEQLVCLPMIAALVLITRRPSTARLLLAGLCIGVVGVLKLWTAAVPVAAVLAWLLVEAVAAGRRGEPVRSVLLTRVGLVAAGALAPVVAVLVWLAAAGSLGAALETWLVFPGQMLGLPGARSLDRLVEGSTRYVGLLAPALLLAAAALPGVLRRRDPLGMALLAWLVVGLVGILIQLWWPYHWTQLTPALVGLAALGLRQLRDAGWLGRPLVVAVLALSTAPLLYFGVLGAERPTMLGNGFTADSRARLAELGTLPTAQRELAAIGYRPGESLMVFGDPTFQLAAGARMPVRINGWSPELYTTAQFAEMADTLAVARPDVVLVTALNVAVVPERGPAVARLIANEYEQVRSTPVGDWYRLRTDR
ncbi:hypothetical protein [Pseudonocardia humida]|uniref:Dolichyl-phosphate-mannose-protein mannosyltransferase n=1 Tax=Pseudonocardia humida TaxID=2800819 RepID=A0ABT1A5R5_9PSEU|nr:hypothetical protein [Pseudonocardia humida]MCO1658248.1 hypothetical protein [Pseudonocardia humida]